MTGKTALILGATGGSGHAVARALMGDGWQITALHRHPEQVHSLLPEARWVKGDAMDRAAVVAAAADASLIFHGVNPPGYKNWPEQVLPMLENSIAAAGSCGARLVLPGTVYNFGENAVPVVTEITAQIPTTRKGAIRVAMEERLKAASVQDGVRVLIVRAGDFFGAHVANSWFSQVLVKPGKPLRSITYPGSAAAGHAWAYLPDFAAAVSGLVSREDQLAPFDVYHFEGHWFKEGPAIAEEIRQLLGKPDLPIRSFPWWAIKGLSPVVPFFREVSEVSYLWKKGLRLENAKLVSALGAEPRTPIAQALQETLGGLGCL